MEKKKKEIPVVELLMDLNDMEHGLGAISFVENPAIDLDWMMFSSDKLHTFELEEEERIIHSPIMLADTNIYRVSQLYGEYFVKFSKDTIKNMMIKYFKDNRIHQVNENHDSKRKVDNVYMVESYIVGDRNTSNSFKDIPKGSWVASFYVEDKDYWNNVVKSENFKGVSLEGRFDEDWENALMEQMFSKIEEVVNSKVLSPEEIYDRIQKIINNK